jgi:transposase
VRKFFEQLGPEQCERIEAALMDMHPVFTLEVEKHCPNARIVYDLFHVIAKYSREIVEYLLTPHLPSTTSNTPSWRYP